MSCENNKKGYNNKILIRTLMLASMVCMLSVSDMCGMDPQGTPIDPYDAMGKINKDPNYYEAFIKIFEGHEDLIKRDCCGCCMDIKLTMLPKDRCNGSDAAQLTVYDYISGRFEIKNDNAIIVNNWDASNATCGALDTIILGIYGASLGC